LDMAAHIYSPFPKLLVHMMFMDSWITIAHRCAPLPLQSF
jgi:hypothetical protein